MTGNTLKTVGGSALAVIVCAFSTVFAQVTVVVNNVGYEKSGAKRAVVQSSGAVSATTFDIVDAAGTVVLPARPLGASATVDSWSGDGFRYFKVADFSAFDTEGDGYRVQVGSVKSQPFSIGEKILQEKTGAEQVSFFSAMRNTESGDRELPVFGSSQKRNIYGGWWDATGDIGKHISHLSYANYFNPQQIPLVVWALLHANDMQPDKFAASAREEAAWGADYLLRALSAEGYFYMSVFDNWGAGYPVTFPPYQPPPESKGPREICAWRDSDGNRTGDYQCAMREGGGVSIAALARAAKAGISRDSSAARYLAGAERAYAHLKANPTRYQDDGKENIIDDYTGLLAATELFSATGSEQYRADARARADSLLSRQHAEGWFYSGKDGDGNNFRPFYHAADEGLPVVALSRYIEVCEPANKAELSGAIGRNLRWYHKITYGEGANPFEYVKMWRGAGAPVSPGVTNIARSGTATASRSEGGFTPDKAIDGSALNDSRWSSYQNGAENNNQWIAVDLGSVYTVNKVVIKWENAYGKSYRIEVSTKDNPSPTNGADWTAVDSVKNGASGGEKTHNVTPIDARHVRMFGVERALEYGGFSIYEFEVYGEKAAPPPPSEGQAKFFVPHENETGYWWQGESARLASMASAFIIGAPHANPGRDGELWYDTLFAMATAQLDWILGRNPFNVCLMYGYGETNYPDYPAARHLENIKGGICNGITADRGAAENNIEWTPYKGTNNESDAFWQNWRWIEQWLPHNAWYTVAVSSLSHRIEHGMPEVISVRHTAAGGKSRFRVSMARNGVVKIDLPFGADDRTEIALYSIQGRTIAKHRVQPNSRAVTMNLPKNTAKGAYVVSIRDASGKSRGAGRIYLR